MDYKEKLEEAKRLYETANVDQRYVLESLFPELKESEDEKIRKWLIALIKSNEYGSISNVGEMPCPKLNVLAWLEKRGEQKPAWSEEDEKMIEAIEAICDDKIRFTEFHDVKEYAYTIKNWLKSLKARYTWKPSDEQIEALASALSLANNCGEEYAFDLRTLHKQLKKLMEE